MTELYKRRKAEGICVGCGKLPAEDGNVRCTACLAVEREKKFAKNKAQRLKASDCIQPETSIDEVVRMAESAGISYGKMSQKLSELGKAGIATTEIKPERNENTMEIEKDDTSRIAVFSKLNKVCRMLCDLKKQYGGEIALTINEDFVDICFNSNGWSVASAERFNEDD